MHRSHRYSIHRWTMWLVHISWCFPCTFRKGESRDSLLYIGPIRAVGIHTVWLGSGISQLKCLKYDWVREFPDYNKRLANKQSIDLLVSNSHGPYMYTLSMYIYRSPNKQLTWSIYVYVISDRPARRDNGENGNM